MSITHNRKVINSQRFDLEGFCQPRRPMKVFEVEVFGAYNLSVACYAHLP